MKTLGVLVVLLSLTAFAGAAMADDADDVRATIERHYSAFNAKDMETSLSHHLEDFTMFAADGGVLWERDWYEAGKRMGATVEIGAPNVSMTNFNAQVYGNVAVVTFYLVGTVDEENVTNRVSAVWVKDGSDWKEAHHHESPLTPAD